MCCRAAVLLRTAVGLAGITSQRPHRWSCVSHAAKLAGTNNRSDSPSDERALCAQPQPASRLRSAQSLRVQEPSASRTATTLAGLATEPRVAPGAPAEPS